MHRMLAALVILLGLATPGLAAGSAGVSASDQAAIRQVITAQIAAFRRDDAAAAFGYASPGIQALYGDPATFLAMVKRGYRPVYRPRSFVFGPLTDSGGKVVQDVDVIGPDGAAHTALYSMQRQPDGKWRISGCELVRDVSA